MRLRDMQAAAMVLLLLMGMMQPGLAQQAGQATPVPDTSNGQTQVSPTQATPVPAAPTPQAMMTDATGTQVPAEPQPTPTQPLFLRDTNRDYTHLYSFLPNPIKDYEPTGYPLPHMNNTPRLDALLRDGKIYLSLSDAVLLALENNFDIAIARVNLDIADTDILRTKAGATFRGVSTGLVTGTLGGSSSTVTGGGGPGGTGTGAGGAGTGANGLVLSTNGGGPTPETLDPTLTSTIQYEAASTQQSTTLLTGTNTLNQNTGTYDFNYNQGFITGTGLSVGFDNSRQTTNSQRSNYSPQLQSTFRAQVTQHLLQGFGPWINKRFMLQAVNNRRITDSAFRQQLLYTINQVENIYWALVSAYEDEQAKERALNQSTQLDQDNRKQLQIGTLAPLDVANSDNAVQTDKQALITSRSNLEYQQLIMKQAIARNLDDPRLANAPVIPTDRVGLDRLPEEDESVDALVKEAYLNNPQIEQAVLSMKNNEITIKAEKQGLLPTVDAYAFYGSSALAGGQNPNLNCSTSLGGGTFTACAPGVGPGGTPIATSGYGSVLQNLFNNSSPDKGVGVNISIPLRNRVAQADQARSQMEYRQTELRLAQLYTQTKFQVINGQYALTNDRAAVVAAQSARDFNAQSLDAEQKKYRLGASTTANVLQQERNLATAEDNLISATAAYARDRASLREILANTLDQYGISISDAATGEVSKPPVIPGLTAPTPPAPPRPLTATPPPPPSPVVP